MVIIPFFLSCALFLEIKETGQPIQYIWFNWLNLHDIHLDIGFYIDQLSVWMMMIVTGVGSIIHIYSIGYMHEDEGFFKFFAYLNLFVFFMLLLVMADNYLILFFGWEGVGLCSYLLIGFYYLKNSASTAGNKAFIVNRIGDFGFSLAMFLIVIHFKTLDFPKVFEAAKALPVADAAAGGVGPRPGAGQAPRPPGVAAPLTPVFPHAQPVAWKPRGDLPSTSPAATRKYLSKKSLRIGNHHVAQNCPSRANDLFRAITRLYRAQPVSYTHLRAHETVLDLVCRLLLEKKKQTYHIRQY